MYCDVQRQDWDILARKYCGIKEVKHESIAKHHACLYLGAAIDETTRIGRAPSKMPKVGTVWHRTVSSYDRRVGTSKLSLFDCL